MTRSRLGAGVLWLVLGGLCLVAGLLLLGVLLHRAQSESESAVERRFAQRAQVSAALTQSVFGAMGSVSTSALVRRYGGTAKAAQRHLEAQARQRTREQGRESGQVYSAVVDGSGAVLAGVGRVPLGLPAATATYGGPALSDVRATPEGPIVDYGIPFRSPAGPRRLVQGVPIKILEAFLTAFIGRVPNPDGTVLVVSDGNGARLARTGPKGRAVPAGKRLSATARLPGTTWRLRLTADRDRVLAGVNRAAWLPWAMLGVLAIAVLGGLWLCGRLLLSSSRVRLANGALRESEGKLRGLVEALEEAVVVKYASGEIDLLNASAKSMFEADGAMIWHGPAPGWGLVDDDGAPLRVADTPTDRALASGQPQRSVVGLNRPDASCTWVEMSARPLIRPGDDAPYAVVSSCTDVTQRHELEAHLAELADRDPLTGLWNRRRFENDLDQQLARCRRYDERAGLLLVDIDGFKQINDTLGHLTGDEVLRALADVLGCRVRSSDRAARLGGDEFAVILINVSELEVKKLAAEMRSKLAEAGRGVQDRLPFSISMGVAMLDRRTSNVAEALGAADRAMYADKQRNSTATAPRGNRELPLPEAPATSSHIPALTALRNVTGADVAWFAHSTPDGRRVAAIVDGGDPLGLAPGCALPDGGRPEAARSFASAQIVDADGKEHGELCVARRDDALEFGDREREMAQALAQAAAAQLLHDGVLRTDAELASLRALLAAVHARDSYTAIHSRQVVTLARAVAKRLGLDEADVSEVEHVALLHDLGKIAIPDSILRKPGPLTPHEQVLMRQHPVVGAEILASTPELAYLAPAIRAEHERWDGAGYPDGLAGEEIPIASRITLVCDAFHAMTNHRPYRRAMSRQAARAEIRSLAGAQFCPAAAAALLEIIGSADTAPVAA